jgi:hypothetical protein
VATLPFRFRFFFQAALDGVRPPKPVFYDPRRALFGSQDPLQLQEGVWSASAHLLKSFLNALLPLEPDAQTEVLESLPSNLVPSVPLVAQKRSSMPPFSSPPISYSPRMDMISRNHGS